MDASLPPPPVPVRCWDCGYSVEPRHRYCPWCGQGQGEHVTWYYRRWGIVVASLLGLGPFGLVLVRRSPLLEAPEKWAWAAAILGLTAYGSWRLYKAVQMISAALGMAAGLY
jgi:hypothetical protein